MLKQLNMLCFYKFLMQLDDPLFCYLDIKKYFTEKFLAYVRIIVGVWSSKNSHAFPVLVLHGCHFLKKNI